MPQDQVQAATVSRHSAAALARGRVFGVLAAVVLLGLAAQLPRVADFEKFAFYDEGAWLHLVDLVGRGAVPGKDVGYSYGMLPLIVSRGWFGLLGRTPWAFMAFVALCNVWGAWGVAGIVTSCGARQIKIKNQNSKIPLLLAAVFLSFGLFPNSYSLMHPLEMALIISALAQQARGRYGGALAFATLAVFTKPSMAYVLGLLLLLLAAWFRKGWKIVVLPAAAAGTAVLLELLSVGIGPLMSNLLPITGGSSYAQMNFGIFRAGRSFWWPQNWDAGFLVQHYLLGPALFWIAATIFLWIAGAMALVRLLRRRDEPLPRDAILATVAVLHAVFVFGFYAWEGSWTYYAYLLVIGLVLGLPAIQTDRLRHILIWGFVAVAVCGLSERFGDGWGRWLVMWRPAQAAGLWAYPDFFGEAQQARALADAAGPGKALWMINGDLSDLWPEARQPPCWFLSPGIPTPVEITKTRALIASSDVVVLCKFYDQKQEAWYWPQFADLTEQFEVAWEGAKEFKVLRRKGTAAQSPNPPIPQSPNPPIPQSLNPSIPQ